MGNFDFLNDIDSALYKSVKFAEKYLYSDPNASMIKIGQASEIAIQYMLDYEGVKPYRYKDNQVSKIKLLKSLKIIPSSIEDILHTLRLDRNLAAHTNESSSAKAKNMLSLLHKFLFWYAKTYFDKNLKSSFVMPTEQEINREYFNSQPKLDEDEIVDLIMSVGERRLPTYSKDELRLAAYVNASAISLDDSELKEVIDEKLRAAGWEADSTSLLYKHGVRPAKGRNIAIADFPIEVADGYPANLANVDYALFVGEEFVGLLDCKGNMPGLPAVIDAYCRLYSEHIPKEYHKYCKYAVGEYYVPLLFAYNGKEYMKERHEQTGVWYLDIRKTYNIPRMLHNMPSPSGMMRMLQKDLLFANKKLKDTPNSYLQDSDGLNLYSFQMDAVNSIEKAILNGRGRILVSMAPGTGKTRIVIGIMHRLLKSGQAKRILFLVDRAVLGYQARDVFKNVNIEQLMHLDDIYNISSIDDSVDSTADIHITTVQEMIDRVTTKEASPRVTDYDVLIVDEAHRGVSAGTVSGVLGDREAMPQDEFVDKYRYLLDYFDAVEIGVTATPDKNTVEIFGEPVFSYSYLDGVFDGYLAPFAPIIKVNTSLATAGINYSAGDAVQYYDRADGVLKEGKIDSDIEFSIAEFNKKIMVQDTVNVALDEVSKHINPEGAGKTLIFAASDAHADMIVNRLREIYIRYELDSRAIMKITSSIGDILTIRDAIKRFQTERFPNIVVTVELLTTGIDVPAIDSLVFMRYVENSALCEQMIGRATRLCERIGKKQFQIFDAVGQFDDAMQSYFMAQSFDTAPEIRYSDIISNILSAEQESVLRYNISLLIEIVNKAVILADGDKIVESAGDFLIRVSDMPFQNAQAYIKKNQELFQRLRKNLEESDSLVAVYSQKDTLLECRFDFNGHSSASEYIQLFKQFVNDNRGNFAALKCITAKPAELSRKDYRALLKALAEDGFFEAHVCYAYGVDDIYSIIEAELTEVNRQAIIPLKARADKMFAELTSKNSFTKIQHYYLEKIRDFLYKEPILDENALNNAIWFKEAGGYRHIDLIFDGKLAEIMAEIRQYHFRHCEKP